ncbi:PstC family ABC transporter permease [Ferrimonas aestuarii]|uniref:ABC transporter permease subunit n=1 Tax=Ferrimonas aestuarii TaxID=2569539 RepID=A0A4U1BSK0_9GAMM|nr:ABC transporter permease subunit [Ferrimonas aestuarii]TKB58386.1 ABC transporter permease subunit [Ferrimonas aestuarii]
MININSQRLLLLPVGLALSLITLLFGFLLYFSLPVIAQSDLSMLIGPWQPESGQFGIGAMILGSLLLGLCATALALPLAIGVVCFCLLERYQTLGLWLRRLIRLMAGMPTVVYALTALFLLVPLLREIFVNSSGFCLLAAILMVVLLILPTMVMMLDNHCLPLVRRYRQLTQSLGFSDLQLLRYLVLPRSGRGLFSATLMGFNRGIGDTLLPMMLAGNAPQFSADLLDSMRTLTAHIGLVIATEHGSGMYNSLFVAGLVLLLFSTLVTALVRRLAAPPKGNATTSSTPGALS